MLNMFTGASKTLGGDNVNKDNLSQRREDFCGHNP